MTSQTDIVVFKVSGSGYPSIQYGTDSDNNQAQGGYGPLGDGDISDSVTEVVTTYCSSGIHKTESFPLASGRTSGGYAIATAEYASGDTGNAQQAESDAGC